MGSAYAIKVERVSLALKLIGAKSVVATGVAMEKTLKRVARQQKTLLTLGWHRPGTKTGSVPPAPPWRIWGAFMREVKVFGPTLFGVVRPRWEGKVGSTVVYSRIHELGGWTGAGHRTYLPPRPSLRPAWLIVMPTVRPTFEHELKRALRL